MMRLDRPLRPLLAWVAFPVAPALLATTYAAALAPVQSDPRLWDALNWAVQIGPLLGFSFLAGATLGLPDPSPPPAGRLRRVLGRRALWVAVAPWAGFLVWAAIFYGLLALDDLGGRFLGARPVTSVTLPDWSQPLLLYGLLVPTLAYGWLLAAVAAWRRARRLGRLGRSLWAGLATSAAFLASLFGGFWAATEVWRPYFFDARVARALVPVAAALGLVALCGCAGPTVGDLRRRDFFGSMLLAWTLGLALAWRWWSRPRGRRGGGAGKPD